MNNTDNIIDNSSTCPQKTTFPAVVQPSQYITDSNKTKRQHSNTQTESKAPQRKKKRIFSNTQPKSEDSQVKKQLVASNDTLLNLFTTALNVAQSMYVLAVISYGIDHQYDFAIVEHTICVVKIC